MALLAVASVMRNGELVGLEELAEMARIAMPASHRFRQHFHRMPESIILACPASGYRDSLSKRELFTMPRNRHPHHNRRQNRTNELDDNTDMHDGHFNQRSKAQRTNPSHKEHRIHLFRPSFCSSPVSIEPVSYPIDETNPPTPFIYIQTSVSAILR